VTISFLMVEDGSRLSGAYLYRCLRTRESGIVDAVGARAMRSISDGQQRRRWLALFAMALASAAACSGGALSGAASCDGLAVPLIACAVGRTVPVCATDPMGRPYWKITCPDDPTGQGGRGGTTGTAGTTGVGGTTGAGGNGVGGTGGAADAGAGGAPCASTQSCAADEICTTQDGVCNAPPGCGPGVACPAVCYGNCRPSTDGPGCGPTRCATGMICCNSSCGVCTTPTGGCTLQICTQPAGGGACQGDSDCRLQADYCTGCDCRSLAAGQTLPPCSGPGVRCLRDPCSQATAACVNGYCVIR
jgi:hypothetical protein